MRKLLTSHGEGVLQKLKRQRTFKKLFTKRSVNLSMSSTLIVGIDISSELNAASFIDEAGNRLVKKALFFPNDLDGAQQLIDFTISLAQQFNIILSYH